MASAFGTLLTPILKLFNSILAALVTLVRKSLHRYTFLALSAFEGLLSLQNHWDELLSRRGPDTVTDKNELKDAIQSLRALCLRSFPEFLADIKLSATSRSSDTSTKLTGFTVSVCSSLVCRCKVSIHIILQTVRYITKVPEVRSAVSSALLVLGDGNWKMGEGVQVGQAREGDESAILEHFIGEFSFCCSGHDT